MTKATETPAATLSAADSQIIAKQVADWRREVARLQELIAHATSATIPDGIDLDKLEALARAATPGPWELRATEWSYYAVEAAHPEWGAMCEVAPSRKSNMEFIVGANPAAVLELIALARRAAQQAPVAQAVEAWPEHVQMLRQAADIFTELADARVCESGSSAEWMERCLPKIDALEAGAPVAAAAPAGDAKDAPTDAARDVLAERRRQVEQEGWTPARDDAYQSLELNRAAACYVSFGSGQAPSAWPWAAEWWKPRTYRDNMVKAGALILAEIERVDRAAMSATQQGDRHD